MMQQPLWAPSFPTHGSQMFPGAPTLDEFPRQQTPSDLSNRISRGSSNGHWPTNAMRIVKPSSASNSPQSLMQRRRTMMNDSNLARRRQYALDQAILNQQVQNSASPYEHYQEPVKKASRPVSWHPSSHLQPQMQLHQLPQFEMAHYMMPGSTPCTDTDPYISYNQFPPTPATYSNHTSPVSTFSPLSLPFTASSQAQAPQYIKADTWTAPAYASTAPYSTSGSPSITEPFPSYAAQPSLNWETFASNGFNSSTSPPTPDNYHLQEPPAKPVVTPEECIPFQALEESEEEGEILVGMGLYDTPDKSETDPGLDHYRTTTSHLLGATYRKGAGLKLEEAWSPPKDDEESSDEDESQVEDE